jgi:hypothetical protein
MMALFDDLLSGWGSTVLIGVGVAIAAPVLLPAVGAVVRPVVKGLVKGGLLVADSLKELAADGAKQVGDLVAEAKSEYYTSASTRSV